MKTTLLIVLSVSLFSVCPLRGADPENNPPKVEQRLREVDLAIALKQYERVRMEEFDLSLKLESLQTDGEGQNPEARKKQERILLNKIAGLHQRGDELRELILKLGNGPVVAKNK
jgi:hypothetical protein